MFLKVGEDRLVSLTEEAKRLQPPVPPPQAPQAQVPAHRTVHQQTILRNQKQSVRQSKMPRQQQQSRRPPHQANNPQPPAAPAEPLLPQPVAQRPQAHPPPLPANDVLRGKMMIAFNYADANGDGVISQAEMFDLLQKLLGTSITKAEANRIYLEMDNNRSGLITYDEFEAAVLKYNWDVGKLQLPLTTTTPTGTKYEWEIPYSEIKFGKKIGEGTFGVVFRASWRGAEVAVKVLKNVEADAHLLDDFKQEISLMGKMRHPYVVLFMGACTQDVDHLCIVSEFLETGSVHDLLHVRHVKLDLRAVVRIARHTAFAINYLHLSSIIHRDLKPANLLMEGNKVKLCDFGLSCVRPLSGQLSEQVGSPLWMAPELLVGRDYNEKASTSCSRQTCRTVASPLSSSSAKWAGRIFGPNCRPTALRHS
eukprot:TRINITY_DN1607_c0_g1_i2.p1 TRINITY_DN1607_c0_g1~~TRINITY_DN1607_c0_g1_i2.p1  ORF type:complete len:422 (-),score=73.77 TRINITY_DN1607_c0_g1_i2:556-1821(-)